MKTKNYTSKLTASILVLLFGLFLIWGTLSSSDFPRGLYAPPRLPDDATYWAAFDSLNANIVWNYGGLWSGGGAFNPDTLLKYCDQYGMKSILRHGKGSDYLVEYYAYSQYDKFEVELDANTARTRMLDVDGTGYAYIDQLEGEIDNNLPPGGASWRLLAASHDAGIALIGPKETTDHNMDYAYETPSWHWPDNFKKRTFLHRIRTRSVFNTQPASTPVLKMYVDYYIDSTTYVRWDSLTLTAGDYAESGVFQIDTISTTITAEAVRRMGDVKGIGYKIYWYDEVDVWIDWIEMMDMDRAYDMFVQDPAGVLKDIVDQCSTLESSLYYADAIGGWAMSDEPKRCSFRAHQKIAEAMEGAGLKTPQTPLWQHRTYRKASTFVSVADPPILEIDPYHFNWNNAVGNQSELTTISDKYERAYAASRMNNAALQVTAQAFGKIDSASYLKKQRYPTRSEILVQAFMALAHGARGIAYWKYRTKDETAGQNNSVGLVTPRDHANPYTHPEGPPLYYHRRWQAVHDVFEYLDSVGDILLSLERDTAFCVYDDNSAFISPLTDIYFEDDDDDYIEVGQFHTTQNDTGYVIIVNRRTDADRHITVGTDLSGTTVLEDIYTREQFVSSKGTIKGIPFNAGEGRVFRIVEKVEEDKVSILGSGLVPGVVLAILALLILL